MVIETLKTLVMATIRYCLLGMGHVAGVLRMRDKGTHPTMLLIRPDAVGDFIIFAPAIAVIRSHYRDWHIVAVVQDRVAVLANSCPSIDATIGIDRERYRHNPFYALSVLMRVRRLRSTMCVNTTYSRNIVCDEIALWSGAKVVVGWRGVWIDRLPVLKRRYDGMYTKLLEHIFPPNTHEMRRHEMLLDALGAKEIKLLPQFWSLESQTNEHVTEPITKALKVPKFIVLVPGADAPARRWPISHYGQIVAKLRNQYPEFQVFLVGSDKEREEIGDPASREGFEGSLDLMGKTTLLELSLLIQRSSLVFGNETGPLHIAVALGIPTVSILGGGHYGRFMPYSDGPRNRVVTNHLDCFGCNWECVRSRVECIEDVQVERVWAEVENALSENER